jgi:hypothetical protein
MGRLRYGMGDGGGSGVAPSKDPKPDIDHVITNEELASIKFASGDEAIAYYTFLVRTVSLMTKCAFSTDLWKQISSSPELVGVMASSEDGRAWLEAFINSEAAFLSFTQPKLFQSLQILRNFMEVNILPKQYGMEIKGRLPAFIAGAQSMDYTDVAVSFAGSVAVVNFGDLRASSVSSDIDAINEVTTKYAPKPTMGVWPLATIVVVGVIAIILTGFLYAAWVDYLNSKKIPPEIRKALEKADPQTVERILDKWANMSGMFSQLSDALMWGTIGLGVIVVGGTVLWIASK